MPRNNGRLYNLVHVKYDCKYHIVWTTKYRGKVMTDTYIKQEFRRIFKSIAQWKNFEIYAWHIGDEHVHLYLSIQPSYSISYAIQILKGKSSSWIKKQTKKFPQGSIWARGYFASTVGANKYQIEQYIKNQTQFKANQKKLPFEKAF